MNFNKNWKLYYSKKNLESLNFSGIEYFDGINLPITFEEALFKNKILGHPYYSTNNWDYQRFESYHQYYVKSFNSKKTEQIIYFKGIDTIAKIYLNGVLIAETDNAFLSYYFELKNLKKKNNVLVVHILPSAIEGMKHDFSNIRQAAKYNFESLYIRKPASSFGWDILPRTCLGGIYQGVYLLDKISLVTNLKIEATEITTKQAILRISIKPIKGIKFLIKGFCKDSYFENEFEKEIVIKIINPKLWTIRGYGEQNLYHIDIAAIENGNIVERKELDYGIRKIDFKRSSCVSKDGSFAFYINNEKVFLMGTNWVPIEAIKHLDNKRAFKAIELLIKAGCNAIRIWGGGIYETDEVYSLCDKLGIFIWQDFMMGCATYPQDDEFTSKIKFEVEKIVSRLYNHCSICLWAGDNENDLASCSWAVVKDDPNNNIITRKIIPDVLNNEDKTRPYLPSSPYIDDYAYNHRKETLSEDHLWGPRDYFKSEYYKNTYPYFVSETGYHGLNSPKSLKKFMKKPWPMFNSSNQPTKEYMCHGVTVKDDMNSPYLYRTELMANQVKILFSNSINNLSDFSIASQISQAEAMKFFIEKMRRDTKRNGGIIWWNIIDGWPQISDAVVDYYFNKKLAYYYIKRSQQPILIFMDEDLEKINVYISSLITTEETLTYEITDGYTGEIIDKGIVKAKENQSYVFKIIKNDNIHHFYIIKYWNKKRKCLNTFHTNIINIDFYRYLNVLQKYKLNK